MGTDTYSTPTPTSASRSGTATLTAPAQAAVETGPSTWLNEAPAHTGARPRSPEPRLRQLMGVCGWAAVLGGIGLVIGIRGIFGVIADDPPAWYQPAVLVSGLSGIVLTVGAFLTVQLRRIPWILLTLASAGFGLALVFTSRAF